MQGSKKVTNIQLFRVYDRWGTLIYEGSDLTINDANSGWDGTYKGKTMNSAVFAWYAVVQFADGYEEVYKGDVTLYISCMVTVIKENINYDESKK